MTQTVNGVDIESGVDSLTLTFRWNKIPGLRFAAIAIGLALLQGSIYNYVNLVLTLMTFSVFWIAYLILLLTLLMNRTIVEVQQSELSVTHAPFPWLENNRIPRSAITQLFVDERHTFSERLKWYRLIAITADKKRLQLLWALPSREAGLVIEKELEKYLGIKDQTIFGEVRYDIEQMGQTMIPIHNVIDEQLSYKRSSSGNIWIILSLGGLVGELRFEKKTWMELYTRAHSADGQWLIQRPSLLRSPYVIAEAESARRVARTTRVRSMWGLQGVLEFYRGDSYRWVKLGDFPKTERAFVTEDGSEIIVFERLDVEEGTLQVSLKARELPELSLLALLGVQLMLDEEPSYS